MWKRGIFLSFNQLDRSNSHYQSLKEKVKPFQFDLDSFLSKLAFNLILQNSIHAKNFDLNAYMKELDEVLEQLSNHQIPETYSDVLLSNFDIRKIIVALQGFSLTSKNWVAPFASFIGDRQVLEIMSGVGVLAHALREEGKTVHATDNYTATNFDFNQLWTDIEPLDALEAIEKYGASCDVIIMSWCYTDELGYECLLKMREVNPNAVMIYIGEVAGRSTGSKSLYDNMIELEDEQIKQINQLYPTWHGVTDRLFLIK